MTSPRGVPWVGRGPAQTRGGVCARSRVVHPNTRGHRRTPETHARVLFANSPALYLHPGRPGQPFDLVKVAGGRPQLDLQGNPTANGYRSVLVNGEVSIDDNQPTGATAWTMLRAFDA